MKLDKIIVHTWVEGQSKPTTEKLYYFVQWIYAGDTLIAVVADMNDGQIHNFKLSEHPMQIQVK